MTKTLDLAAQLDSQAAKSLFDELGKHIGAPLEIRAGKVAFLGAMAVQTLISARLQWQSDSVAFSLVEPSEAFFADLTTLGLPPEAVGLTAAMEIAE